MNETYLGFELTVNEATNIEKLKIICDTPYEVKSSEVEKLEEEIVDLNEKIDEAKASNIENKKNLKTVKINNKNIKAFSDEKTKSEERIKLLKLNRGVYPKIQFNSAVKLTKEWLEKFNIDPKYVVRHSDISSSNIKHGFKFDPGQDFDWNQFKNEINSVLKVKDANSKDKPI